MPSSSIFTGLSGEIPLRFWRFELDFFSSLSSSSSSSSSVFEVRWETWTASKIYLAPHPDEENAVALINLKKTMSNGIIQFF